MKKLSWILLLLTSACAPNKNKQAIDQVDQLFRSEFKDNEPGGAVLVMKDGAVIFKKGYGIADVGTKEKITTTLFNTGSISKTFVSNTILSLAEEGKLSLNDSLDRYFPEFKNKAIAQKIKIHDLLTHTSGLPDNRRLLLDSVFLLSAKDRENWAPITQCDSLLFAPGSRYEYSNPAFNGLALIIEQVTKTKWQTVVAERIFKPAGMATSKITDGAYPDQGVAHGYLKTATGYLEKDYGEEPTFAAAGNGGIWSSVEELARYEQALQQAAFLKKETIERSRTITRYDNWTDSVAPFIGYSWFIGKTLAGQEIVSHTGSQGGFLADYVSIPENKLFFVILCNRPYPREAFRKKILDLFNPEK